MPKSKWNYLNRKHTISNDFHSKLAGSLVTLFVKYFHYLRLLEFSLSVLQLYVAHYRERGGIDGKSKTSHNWFYIESRKHNLTYSGTNYSQSNYISVTFSHLILEALRLNSIKAWNSALMHALSSIQRNHHVAAFFLRSISVFVFRFNLSNLKQINSVDCSVDGFVSLVDNFREREEINYSAKRRPVSLSRFPSGANIFISREPQFRPITLPFFRKHLFNATINMFVCWYAVHYRSLSCCGRERERRRRCAGKRVLILFMTQPVF